MCFRKKQKYEGGKFPVSGLTFVEVNHNRAIAVVLVLHLQADTFCGKHHISKPGPNRILVTLEMTAGTFNNYFQVNSLNSYNVEDSINDL